MTTQPSSNSKTAFGRMVHILATVLVSLTLALALPGVVTIPRRRLAVISPHGLELNMVPVSSMLFLK